MYRISQIASQLSVSQTTVRRLTERFAAHLSDERDRRGGRRFSAEDLERLRTIQSLRASGRSDDEIEAALVTATAADDGAIVEAERPDETEGDSALALVASGDALPMSPQAAALLAQALQQLSEMQQALVATQEQHRELLSTLSDESGALKDENERLRRRLRMMEEEMSQLKESDWAQRVTLEDRLNHLERGNETRPSWWARVFRR